MELEKDGSLPFLDANLTRKEDGTLNISVFRKQTHTDRYLQFNSHHPVSAKRAAVRSLFDRARNITLHSYFQAEWLPFTIHSFHLLHAETIYTTRRPR